MDDFWPDAIAGEGGALSQLLEARTQLENLQTYRDGKAGAEGLVMQVLQDKALLNSLAKAPRQDSVCTDAVTGDE
mgnify:CR=1 FL=1